MTVPTVSPIGSPAPGATQLSNVASSSNANTEVMNNNMDVDSSLAEANVSHITHADVEADMKIAFTLLKSSIRDLSLYIASAPAGVELTNARTSLANKMKDLKMMKAVCSSMSDDTSSVASVSTSSVISPSRTETFVSRAPTAIVPKLYIITAFARDFFNKFYKNVGSVSSSGSASSSKRSHVQAALDNDVHSSSAKSKYAHAYTPVDRSSSVSPPASRSVTPRREIALNLALLLSTGAWFSASASVTTNAWLITIARLSVGSHLKKNSITTHYLISKNEMSYNMAKTYIMLLISGFADIISTVGLIQKTDLINKQVGSSNWYYVILSSTAFDQDMFKNASKINDL
ncbi:hypothetical protein BDF21DRAFT_450963 [Thamnidium elegans]|nr:hypothetical protein BDF21DRAFT_450963 [Thamnidium elegans]